MICLYLMHSFLSELSFRCIVSIQFLCLLLLFQVLLWSWSLVSCQMLYISFWLSGRLPIHLGWWCLVLCLILMHSSMWIYLPHYMTPDVRWILALWGWVVIIDIYTLKYLLIYAALFFVNDRKLGGKKGEKKERNYVWQSNVCYSSCAQLVIFSCPIKICTIHTW